MNFDILHNFISPVTGRVLADPNYVLVGDRDGVATASPILIDIRLELIDLRKEIDDINALADEVGFIISEPDSRLPKSQALSVLEDGFMYNTGGIVSTTTAILPTLPYSFLWIGDAENKPTAVPYIEVNNLPNLTENKIWIGSSLNRPQEVDFSIAPDDAKYILQQESPGLPNAQILANLSTGILKNTSISGVLTIASGGAIPGIDDYVTPEALDEAIAEQAAATTAEIAAASAALEAEIAALETEFTAGVVVLEGEIALLQLEKESTSSHDADINTLNNRIDNLTITLSGDVSGSGNLSDIINTSFISNPVFTGNESMTIPVGTTSERPTSSLVGMIRINAEI